MKIQLKNIRTLGVLGFWGLVEILLTFGNILWWNAMKCDENTSKVNIISTKFGLKFLSFGVLGNAAWLWTLSCSLLDINIIIIL